MLKLLISNAKKLGLNINNIQAELLLEYLANLQQWNQVHNLCAKADNLHMLGYHILDSISVIPKISYNNKKILDVGTGAGLPGIPMAILANTAKFTLLDSRSKKLIFVKHVLHKLNLTNVELVLARVENYNPINKFDIIISRGLSNLKKFIQFAFRLKKDYSSELIAMKADPDLYTIEEKVFNDYTIKKIDKIEVPLVKAKRSLIFINN